MQYYFNPKKKSTVAHIWTGEDTACKMLSTGGIKPGRKQITDKVNDRPICMMCRESAKRIASTI
jgi:hypothetical protein